jgi:DNA-binding LacI/PurR family transcriptional regulator
LKVADGIPTSAAEPLPVPRRARSFVSAREVADLAGVSRSAVSRTFTAGASVSEETRNKVLQAAQSLGYHVNHLARSLIQESSGIVCIVGAAIDTPHQSRILDAITRRLQAIDRVAMVINTSGDEASVEAALRQTLNYRADATVVLSGTPPASLVDTCLRSGQHVIVINRDDQLVGPQEISVDNDGAAREAFHILFRAGCRNMAIVTSSAGTPSLVERERTFQAAAREAGLDVSVTRAGPTSYEAGYASAKALLPGAGRPDAAFCVTDLLACGFMDGARAEFGISVPDELCVVGFDDIEQAGWSSYELTTFSQPSESIAERIAGLLETSGHGNSGKPRMVFPAKLVWRKSVRPR